MDVKLDVAALVSAIVWPALLGVLAFLYRRPLSRLVAELPGHVKKVSIGGVDVEFADARSATLTLAEGKIDLRKSGTSDDVNDSTLASFYAQIGDPSRIEYAVVDLGSGEEWLSSRLYVLSVLMRRMRGLHALVFVETSGNVRRSFVGVCDCDRVRWRMAARWPRFEAALAGAELVLWGHPYAVPGGEFTIDVNRPWAAAPLMQIGAFSPSPWVRVVNSEGRVEGPQGSADPAAGMLRSFLDAVQRPGPALPEGWVLLPSDTQLGEYAVWLSGALVEQVLKESLDRRSIRVNDFQGWSDRERIRAMVEHPGEWVAFTRPDGGFDRLVRRREVTESVASQALRAAGAG
jgi:hypothetical protein